VVVGAVVGLVPEVTGAADVITGTVVATVWVVQATQTRQASAQNAESRPMGIVTLETMVGLIDLLSSRPHVYSRPPREDLNEL